MVEDAGPSRRSPARRLHPLRVLWPYVLRYKLQLVLAFVFLVIAAGATLAIPLAVRRVIDFGFSSENRELINVYFGTMLLVSLVLAISSAARFYFVNWLGERVVADLRTGVFDHLLGLSASFFDRTRSGEILSRLAADTTQIKSAVGSSASIALRNTFLLSGAIVMMVVTSGKLSAMVLGVIPLIVLPLVGFGRSVRRRSRIAQDTLADATAYAGEHIGAMRTVQAFNNEGAIRDRFSGAVDDAFTAVLASSRARAFLTAGAIFLIFSSIVGVLWYGAQEVIAERLTAGTLSQFLLYAVFAATSMGQLSQVWGEVQQAAGAAERLSELLNVETEVVLPAHPRKLPVPAKGKVEFANVSFSYPGQPERPVLDGLDLEIQPGETVAIVGPSGAGKSTLFHLLLRYYDVASGQVLVDGVPIEAVMPADLRQRMAIVPQEAAIFATSIAENIRFGKLDATDEQVFEAAKAAHADEFISRLPDKYQAHVGERGVTLSGGQRQRLAVARAILRDAPILLLDEATSALDAESETLVQKALERLMKNRTTLVIAHRLATIQNADRILVMDQGRIVEEGSHAALRRKKGLYSRLAALQFEGRDAAE
jgi:ATP-binding cassette, subfamily B, bacterial